MDTQTVFQTGNSLAVTIPKKLSQKLGWKKGKKVYLIHDPVEETVRISTKPLADTGLTQKYFMWKKNFFQKNAALLARLAKYDGE